MLALPLALLLFAAPGDATPRTPAPSVYVSPLPDFQKHLGKRPKDSGLFREKALEVRLKNLLGARYETFLANSESGTLKRDGALVTLIGSRPGTDNEAAVLVAWPAKDALTVYLYSKGTVEEHREKPNLFIPPSRDILLTMQKWIPQAPTPAPK